MPVNILISKLNTVGIWRRVAISALAFSIFPAMAQLPTLGSESLLSGVSGNNESQAACAMDGAGNYAVTFTRSDAASNHGIAIQRFDRQGNKVGSLIQPHDLPTALQQESDIAMANDGRFVVVWEDNAARGGNNYDVFFSLYDATATRVAGPTRVNSIATGCRENPRVSMNRDTGEFAVVFAGGANQNAVNVYLKAYSSAGAPINATDTMVNSSANQNTANPDIGFSENNKFVVAWEGDSNLDFFWEATFQRYHLSGSSISLDGGNVIASASGADTTLVDVSADEAGNFVMAWVDGLPTSQTDPKDLLFRTYSAAGSPTSAITTFKTGAFGGNGELQYPRIRTAMEDDQDFVLTWQHNDEIYAAFYNSNGTQKGSDIHVNTTTSPTSGEFQAAPYVAANAHGNRAIVTWNGTAATIGNNGALGQRFAETNVAPDLADTTDKSTPEMQEITFTASASESALNFGDTITYSLAAGAPTSASIDPQTGVFSWTPGEHDGPGTFYITVEATDNGEPPLTDSDPVAITVTEANTAPTNLALDNATIAENVVVGTTVGAFSATDSDFPANTFTYSLVAGSGDTDNGSFSIDGDSLKIQVSPDFETQASYSIRVQADDGAGGTFIKSFTITITDVFESSVDDWRMY